MAETVANIVNITESAAEEIKSLMTKSGIIENKYLRVGVKGGGCSGLSYVIDFDDKNPMDEEYDIKGVRVVIDKRQAMYLMGTELDFQSGLNDRGFIFNNPNASETCGCGTSFSV